MENTHYPKQQQVARQGGPVLGDSKTMKMRTMAIAGTLHHYPNSSGLMWEGISRAQKHLLELVALSGLMAGTA